ncbi:MAG: hypothetical protein RMM08_01705 [Armatimonadota bacterium]|nr:hypothetical protein [Armatimonadota bacterium]
MPNLTSVERLARFYEDDRNYFAILLIQYDIQETEITVKKAHFVPIEFLSWDCLTIGALGWGQIQIADANQIRIRDGYSRKQWMLELCEKLELFYPREIAKIAGRLQHFERVKQFWLNKPDE